MVHPEGNLEGGIGADKPKGEEEDSKPEVSDDGSTACKTKEDCVELDPQGDCFQGKCVDGNGCIIGVEEPVEGDEETTCDAKESEEEDTSPEGLEAEVLKKALAYYKQNGADGVRKKKYLQPTVPLYTAKKMLSPKGSDPEFDKKWRKLKPHSKRKEIVESVNEKLFQMRAEEVTRSVQAYMMSNKQLIDDAEEEDAFQVTAFGDLELGLAWNANDEDLGDQVEGWNGLSNDEKEP